jgi:hypothetical protein
LVTWLELGLVWLPWLAGALVCSVVLALSATAGAAQRAITVGLAAIGLLAPFLAPRQPLLRGILSLYLAWAFVNIIELAREPRPRSWRFRAAQVLVLHDLRRDAYARENLTPDVRLSLLLSALAAGAGALLCWYCVRWAEALPAPWLRWLGRYSAGLLLTYVAVEAVVRLLSFFYRCIGLRPPRLHDHPILSRSIAEFWGRRWNRIVGAWLGAVAFSPLSARGHPRLGVVLAFALSALLHIYFTWAAVGLGLALMMASFFLVQPPLLVFERLLRVRNWRRPWQRTWTLGTLIALSPLFVEPFLRVVQPQ